MEVESQSWIQYIDGKAEVTEIGEAPIKLSNGRTARVTMHILEGSKEEIEAQLRHSVTAFFDLYPEI